MFIISSLIDKTGGIVETYENHLNIVLIYCKINLFRKFYGWR